MAEALLQIKAEGLQVAGEVPGNLQNTALVPLSKVLNPPNALIGPSDELQAHPWMYLAFACRQLGQAPAPPRHLDKGKNGREEQKIIILLKVWSLQKPGFLQQKLESNFHYRPFLWFHSGQCKASGLPLELIGISVP